ncbi:hypothetical protein B0H15DRAFT_578202 [Mycena belliarum]|uniref:Uncharacterized protein n=1 Tax=Mycena belliarum TaxID=1033014 RepID=A0AAD6XIC3_9AGAR|nr:hypothetical protein B0H15DRAFT_578202 [Mycena belliae]
MQTRRHRSRGLLQRGLIQALFTPGVKAATCFSPLSSLAESTCCTRSRNIRPSSPRRQHRSRPRHHLGRRRLLRPLPRPPEHIGSDTSTLQASSPLVLSLFCGSRSPAQAFLHPSNPNLR